MFCCDIFENVLKNMAKKGQFKVFHENAVFPALLRFKSCVILNLHLISYYKYILLESIAQKDSCACGGSYILQW